MANITINDLQPAEFAELSDLQLEGIVGGKKSPINVIKDIGRKIDQGVRKNVPGGWAGVVQTGIKLFR